MNYLLLFTIFVVSTCGLIYELVAGTLASYLLGDSITQFSTVIGTYLFAMGIGSYLSKFIVKDILKVFITIEILTGLVGGLSSTLLFLCFTYGAYFQFSLYALISITGVFVGLEIPLIMRIMKDDNKFEDLVSKVFTFDYIGALLASLAFPILLVPHLHLTRTSVLFGLFNVGLAMYLIYYFKNTLVTSTKLYVQGLVVGVILIFAFIFARQIVRYSEEGMHQEGIVYATNSPYQRIVLTREFNAYSLFLNNHLQFNTRDEYRYHEALVHPVMSQAKVIKNVLILGGGDGFAAREVLKYKEVENITLVDLDKKLTQLFISNAVMLNLNNRSLLNKKVKIINADAYTWIQNLKKPNIDVVIIDFPDPTNFSVGKLYSLTFFKELQRILKPETKVVIQSTSPLFAKESFWCINSTIEASYLQTQPYHAYVPSFGEWGFILFGQDLGAQKNIRNLNNLKFYSPKQFASMKYFPKDMMVKEKTINTLDSQPLIPLFEKEWDILF